MVAALPLEQARELAVMTKNLLVESSGVNADEVDWDDSENQEEFMKQTHAVALLLAHDEYNIPGFYYESNNVGEAYKRALARTFPDLSKQTGIALS